MHDYSHLSPSEFTDLVLLQVKLDKEPVDNYLVPRWNLFEEQFIQIFQQEINTESKKETALVFLLLIAEPYSRGQLNRILNTSLSDREIVDNLLPFHRDIKDLVEVLQKEALTFSAPMLQVALKVKEPYQELLEELTRIIRQHSPKAEISSNSDQSSAVSPLQKEVQLVQAKVIEKWEEEKRDKQFLITVNPDDLQKVVKTLRPYTEPESQKDLYQLLTTGASTERIKFTGNALQLGEIFQRFQKNRFLIGGKFDSRVIVWLSHHFFYRNRRSGNFCPVTMDSIKKVFKENKKPKEPLFLQI